MTELTKQKMREIIAAFADAKPKDIILVMVATVVFLLLSQQTQIIIVVAFTLVLFNRITKLEKINET